MSKNIPAIIDQLKQEHKNLQQTLAQELTTGQKQKTYALLERIADKLSALIKKHPDEEARQMAVDTYKNNLERLEIKANRGILNIDRKLGTIEEIISDLEQEKDHSEN
jgi:hemerythrin